MVAAFAAAVKPEVTGPPASEFSSSAMVERESFDPNTLAFEAACHVEALEAHG
jgi:hypothetical protein